MRHFVRRLRNEEELESLRRELREGREAASRGSQRPRDRRSDRQRAGAWRVPRESVPLFFVMGAPRSGTNWVMRTLNHHPEILCWGEGRFFGRNWHAPHLAKARVTEHVKMPVQPSSLHFALAKSPLLRMWVERSVWTRGQEAEEEIEAMLAAATRSVMARRLRGRKGKLMVGDKTPSPGAGAAEFVLRLLPEARVLHVIRDGRDVAVSTMHHLWNRPVSEGGTQRVGEDELRLRNLYRAGALARGIFTEERLASIAAGWAAKAVGPRGADRYAEVRYEGLLSDPNGEYRRLFDFLGAASDEETVAECVASTTFERRSGGRRSGSEVSGSGLRKGISGDWRNVFTERDKEVFKEVAGDALVKFGYEKDDGWR